MEAEMPSLVVKVNGPNHAMNTVGLPSPPKQEESELQQNSVDLQLNRDETYISAPLEISGRSLMEARKAFKSKSLDQLNVMKSYNYHETQARSISFSNIRLLDQCSLLPPSEAASADNYLPQHFLPHHMTSSMVMNRDGSNSPILIAPSMCDLENIDDLGNDSNFTVSNDTVDDSSMDDLLNNRTMQNELDCTPIFLNPDNTPNFSIFNRNSSPTSFSEINYQNSELSIRSQDLYAPAENDLNFILAERDNLNFSISDDDDVDNGNCAAEFNCSSDFLIHPHQSDEDGIDMLYSQVRGPEVVSPVRPKPPPPPKPKNIKVTRHYVFQQPALLSPGDDESSIME